MRDMLPFHYGLSLALQKSIQLQCIVDVGVHKFFFLEFYAGVAKEVIGYEANMNSFESISNELTTSYIENASIEHKAISNSDGVVDFFENKVDSAYSTFNAEYVSYLTDQFSDEDWNQTSVNSTTLDNEFGAEYGIDLIKIDIEADGFNVIEGAVNTIDLNRPILQVEHVLDTGRGIKEIRNILDTLRYRVVTPPFFTDQFFFVPQELVTP